MTFMRGFAVVIAFSISCSAFSAKQVRLCTDEELLSYNLFMDNNQLIIDRKVVQNLVSLDCQEKMGKVATDLKNNKPLCGKTFDYCEGKSTDYKLYEAKIFGDDGKSLCGNVSLTINSEECADYIK